MAKYKIGLLTIIGVMLGVTNIYAEDIVNHVYPVAGASVSANAHSLRTEILYAPSNTVSLVNDRKQEVWVPIGLGASIGENTNAIISVYFVRDGKQFTLNTFELVKGAETYVSMPAYPALQADDVISISASTTNNVYILSVIKQTIPR